MDQRLPELVAVITPARTDIVGVRQSGDTRDKRETIAQALSLIIAADIATPLKSIAAGSAGAPSLAWGDGDTGFYELSDGIINFTSQGVGVWSFRTGAILPFNAAGPAMLNEAATSINPTFAPNAADLNTGLGWNAEDQLSLVAGGVEIARITEAAGANQFAIASSGAPTTVPELTSLADPDTGFAWAGSNQIDVLTAGSISWSFSSAKFFSALSDGPCIANVAANNAIAIFRPDQSDVDTGFAYHGNDAASITVGGIAGLILKELNSGVIQVPVADVAITAFATGGQGSAVALKQSYNVLATVATAGDSVKLPATFLVDSQVYIKNDGAESADVFPASGDDLGAGVDTAVAVAAGTSAVFIATAANATWTQLLQFASGGADPSLLGNGTVGAPSYSFTNSPTTGFYRQAADSLGIATAGVARFEFKGNVLQSENVSGPAMVNAAISASIPQFCPNQNDLNTGLGSPGQDEVSLIAAGVEAVRYFDPGVTGKIIASYQLADSLTAFATGGQTNATLIGSSHNEFTTVATAGDSAKLMTGHPKGTKVFVKNNGAESMDIFPALGDQIDGLGLNTAISLPAGKSVLFMTTTGNDTWTVMDFGIIPDPLLLGDGTAGAPSYSFTNSPTTGIYRSAADRLAFAVAGVGKFQFRGNNFESLVGNSPIILNEAATGTNPTLIPHGGDSSTGIGANAATGELSLISAGVEVARFVNTAGVDQVIIHPGFIPNDPLTPSLAFGDGDSGWYETADDTLALALVGAKRFEFTLNQILGEDGTNSLPTYSFVDDPDTGIYTGFDNVLDITLGGVRSWTFQAGQFNNQTGNSAVILAEASTDTNPTFAPNVSDKQTGIGGVSGVLSLIANSQIGMRISEASGASKIGFYATTPVALQTGVAVTAGGIHAALVSLGLITA